MYRDLSFSMCVGTFVWRKTRLSSYSPVSKINVHSVAMQGMCFQF